MGCSNSTCMISGLPILYGDPIVTLIIKQNKVGAWGNECYPDAEATIIAPPIFCDYNDYGGVENIKSPLGHDELTNYLLESLIPADGYDLGADTENSIHCFKKDLKGLESIINKNIERGYCAINNNYPQFQSEKSNVSLAMIHLKIWSLIQKTDISDSIIEQVSINREVPEIILDIVKSPVYNFHCYDGFPAEKMDIKSEIQLIKLGAYLSQMRINIRPISGQGSQSQKWNMLLDLNKEAFSMIEKRLIDERDEY